MVKEYSNQSICESRLNILKGSMENGVFNPKIEDICELQSRRNGGEDMKSMKMAEIEGIEELDRLFHDVYNIENDNYTNMTDDMKSLYNERLDLFISTSLGKTRRPDHINTFNKISLLNFKKGSKYCNPEKMEKFKKIREVDSIFLNEYAKLLKSMNNSVLKRKQKLSKILDSIFKVKRGRIVINPKLNERNLKKFNKVVADIISRMYLSCQKHYLSGLLLFEIIYKKSIKDEKAKQELEDKKAEYDMEMEQKRGVDEIIQDSTKNFFPVSYNPPPQTYSERPYEMMDPNRQITPQFQEEIPENEMEINKYDSNIHDPIETSNIGTMTNNPEQEVESQTPKNHTPNYFPMQQTIPVQTQVETSKLVSPQVSPQASTENKQPITPDITPRKTLQFSNQPTYYSPEPEVEANYIDNEQERARKHSQLMKQIRERQSLTEGSENIVKNKMKTPSNLPVVTESEVSNVNGTSEQSEYSPRAPRRTPRRTPRQTPSITPRVTRSQTLQRSKNIKSFKTIDSIGGLKLSDFGESTTMSKETAHLLEAIPPVDFSQPPYNRADNKERQNYIKTMARLYHMVMKKSKINNFSQKSTKPERLAYTTAPYKQEDENMKALLNTYFEEKHTKFYK